MMVFSMVCPKSFKRTLILRISRIKYFLSVDSSTSVIHLLQTLFFPVTDWMPTIFEFLNASDVLADSQLDGLSHWSAILDQSVSPRHSLLYNIDYRYNVTTAALRVGDMKLHRNAQLQPIYSIPQTNNLTVDMSHYENTEYVDYLFNLTADPTESHDLKVPT